MIAWLAPTAIKGVGKEVNIAGNETIYGEPARKCIEFIGTNNSFGYKPDGFTVSYDKLGQVVTFNALRQNQYGTWEKGYAECSFSRQGEGRHSFPIWLLQRT